MNDFRDWITTFGIIVARPHTQTFLREAVKARGKFPSAVGWLAFVAAFSSVAIMILVEIPFSPALIIFVAIILPIAFLFFVFCLHLLPKRLFGKKQDNYDELLYLSVGIFVPFTLLAVLVTWIPSVGPTVSNIVDLYAIGLTIIAVSAITKLSLLKSFLVVLLALVAALSSFFCIAAGLVGLMQAVPGVLS